MNSAFLYAYLVCLIIDISSLIIDYALIENGRTSISALALSTPWFSMLILLLQQLLAVFLALHFYL